MKLPAWNSLVLAGGGNRCLWELGFWMRVSPELPSQPGIMAGVSAGATMGCFFLGKVESEATDYFYRHTSRNPKNFYPTWLLRGRRPFPHLEIYRGMLLNCFTPEAMENLRRGPEMRVLVAHPPRFLGPVTGAVTGILLYSLEKALTHPLHPRLPAMSGFTPRVERAGDAQNAGELAELLLASSCTPPFLPPMKRGGLWALDGGMVDNVGLACIGPDEGPTLVLLSRRYRPGQLHRRPGVTYLMPSRPIEVEKWDYTNPRLAMQAFRHGVEDAELFLREGPEALQR